MDPNTYNVRVDDPMHSATVLRARVRCVCGGACAFARACARGVQGVQAGGWKAPVRRSDITVCGEAESGWVRLLAGRLLIVN
jgi:hypothetical protein